MKLHQVDSRDIISQEIIFDTLVTQFVATERSCVLKLGTSGELVNYRAPHDTDLGLTVSVLDGYWYDRGWFIEKDIKKDVNAPYKYRHVLTRAQREAIKRKWEVSPSGARNYLEFRRRVTPSLCGCIMIYWCNMWLGIEADGYTHS